MPKNYYFVAAMLGLIITTAVVGITTFAQTTVNASPPNFIKHRQEFKQIIADGDYEAWSEMMTRRVTELKAHATELESNINQETFNRLTEAHQLIQEGKFDEAKTIFQELGMPGPFGPHGMKGMRGMHNGWQQTTTPNAQN